VIFILTNSWNSCTCAFLFNMNLHMLDFNHKWTQINSFHSFQWLQLHSLLYWRVWRVIIDLSLGGLKTWVRERLTIFSMWQYCEVFSSPEHQHSNIGLNIRCPTSDPDWNRLEVIQAKEQAHKAVEDEGQGVGGVLLVPPLVLVH